MLNFLSELIEHQPDNGIFLSERKHVDEISNLSASCFSTGWSENRLLDLLDFPGGIIWHTAPKDCASNVNGYLLIRVVHDEAEILSIGTNMKVRRKGLAAKLLDTAINDLKAKHISKLFLEVSVDNHAAVSLYEKFGFEQIGVRKAYYKLAENSGYQDACVMQLDLKRSPFK